MNSARTPPQNQSEAQRRKREGKVAGGQGDAPDVYYVEGDIPIVIGVPFAGVVGWPKAGSQASAKEWAGFGNGYTERRVALHAEPRGAEGGGDIGVGVEFTDPEVRFLLKNLDFLLKNLDFLLKNLDFLLKNLDFLLKDLDFIMKIGESAGGDDTGGGEG